MNNFEFLNSKFFAFFSKSNGSVATIISLAVIFVIVAIAVIRGIWGGFWHSLIMSILGIAFGVLTLLILTKSVSGFTHKKLMELDIFKVDDTLKLFADDVNGVALGVLFLIIVALFHIVSLIITAIIVGASRLTPKKLKKRGKKVKLNRLLGALIAPVSVIPLSIGFVNITGVFGNKNKIAEWNDKILYTLSGGQIKGISRYTPLVTTIVEIKEKNIDLSKAKEALELIQRGFNPDRIHFDKPTNKLTIALFNQLTTTQEIENWNNLSKVSQIVLNNLSQTNESWNLFTKMISSKLNFGAETQKRNASYIKQIYNIIKLSLENPDETKVKIDYFDENRIKPIQSNISKENQEQLVNIFYKKMINSQDKNVENLAKKLIKSLFNFN
ncbi:MULTISPECIES: hypothetical protein [unclassified Mycoplasma]|uniref:hypothetical protein n=1 Tax=unclassified Mycoplasma TaxID=2683645 RepID=UPI00216AD25E|nr:MULTISPECIES: hypothetical protein [unclassified Mycoplasma]MCS4536645.1 hypothetical protein [Mycoplasma sp. CSL7475-4]MCT4469535.1 hypothetical protein [Mycoplasma sp. HS2188]